jgi:hypothetical protein
MFGKENGPNVPGNIFPGLIVDGITVTGGYCCLLVGVGRIEKEAIFTPFLVRLKFLPNNVYPLNPFVFCSALINCSSTSKTHTRLLEAGVLTI